MTKGNVRPLFRSLSSGCDDASRAPVRCEAEEGCRRDGRVGYCWSRRSGKVRECGRETGRGGGGRRDRRSAGRR